MEIHFPNKLDHQLKFNPAEWESIGRSRSKQHSMQPIAERVGRPSGLPNKKAN
jgi:hypothetical protein